MKRIIGALAALLVLLLAAGTVTAQTLEATVPGDLLGWETDELDVVLSVLETSRVRLEVYSPAFDPDDYRAALEGRPELGDERYDRGEGELGARFSMQRGGSVVFERDFGVAPHATEVLFDGDLAPGEYTLTSSFKGLGKNTFVYSLTSDPAVAVYFDAGATLLFNVRGRELQDVLTVIVEPQDVPATFELYDGDGEAELRGRLTGPSGPIAIPVSGDLEWSTIRLGRPGTYTFSFYQSEGAYQYSNTIGIRTDARLKSTPAGLRYARLAPVSVRIVDTAGLRLPGSYVVESEGQLRTAVLTGLPAGYRLVDTTTTGGIVEGPERVRFGSEGGEAVFVAERVPVPASSLTLEATLEYPGAAQPYPLEVSVDTTPWQLDADGVLTQEVSPGVHTLRVPRIPGASVTGPTAVIVSEGEDARAAYVVRPRAELTLHVDVHTRYVGEEFVFTATGVTAFEQALPGTLTLTLPSGLAGEELLELGGKLRAGEPLVLSVPAIGVEPGIYTVPATLAPWGLNASVEVEVLALPEVEPEAEPEPEQEPAVEPTPESEPEPAPEPEPELEPEAEAPAPLPDFTMERRSTVHVAFQAARVLRCELDAGGRGALAPGAERTFGFSLRVTDPSLYRAPELRPVALPEGKLGVHLVEVMRNGDVVDVTVQVHNYSNEPVIGGVLVPLPLGTESVSGPDCLDGTASGQELLLAHEVPAGGEYVPGSATLDGVAIDDPAVRGDALVWRLPWREAGVISYDVTHTDALPPLASPSLTVLFSEREYRLQGDLGSAAAPDRGPLTAQEAELTAPGALVGNAHELRFEGVHLVADGRNPLAVDVLVLDEDGQPVGDGVLSVAANAELIGPDADPVTSGFQVNVSDGRARIELAPATTPFQLHIAALAATETGALAADAALDVAGTRTGLYQAQLSVTAHLAGPEISGFGRGYAEIPLGANGTLQAALDVGASAAGLDTDRSLAQVPELADRFPLTGAGEEAAPTLRSSDGVAALYTAPGVSVGYYEGKPQVPGVPGLASRTGAHGAVQLAEGFEVQGYAALVASGSLSHDFPGDGTRRYSLGRSVMPGSESVSIVAGAERRTLVRNRDYVIDSYLGAITLVQPLWPYDADLAPQVLHVEYTPAEEVRDSVHGGLGVRYRAEGLTAEVGAAWTGEAQVGAGLSLESGRFDVDARYLASIGASTSVKGSATAAYSLTPIDRLTLKHVTAAENRTSLTYAHDFAWDKSGKLTLSGGVGTVWERGVVSALLGADLRSGNLTLGAAHDQPFSANAPAVSTARVGYDLNANLTLTATGEVTWGRDFRSVLGLVQRIGATELTASYELPTASGAGNRARFGVRAPFRLTDALSLDLHAGAGGALGGGSLDLAGGAALRYRAEGFNASLGGEVAHDGSRFKVVLRGGAAGQLGKDQNLAFDANYQVVPTLEGRAGVAYSLKRGPWNLLTYHRLLTRDDSSVLEGELAVTVNVDNHLQLRPDVAYRLLLDDPDGNAYQGSLFALKYFEPRLGSWDTTLGLGLGGHVLWQPATSAVAYGLSAEAQARLIDEVWLGVGYTFGGFEGITSTTRGGLYVRLDLAVGGQF